MQDAFKKAEKWFEIDKKVKMMINNKHLNIKSTILYKRFYTLFYCYYTYKKFGRFGTISPIKIGRKPKSNVEVASQVDAVDLVPFLPIKICRKPKSNVEVVPQVNAEDAVVTQDTNGDLITTRSSKGRPKAVGNVLEIDNIFVKKNKASKRLVSFRPRK